MVSCFVFFIDYHRFAADIFRMYTRFAETMSWKTEIMSASETDSGGFKEVIALISGKEVYSQLKYESGVHRVQRVPTTESQGRIHTSAITVAVLPEAEDVEVDIDEDRELRIDVMRASGPGGQCVNTTDSAVRITHLPSNLVVQCQDEKSWHKNKARAMQVLRSRLYDKMLREQQAEIAKERRGDYLGGTVQVWFFIDEEGVVQRTLVNESSGHKALDDAAIRVADIIEFSPALNRDKRVPVWISIPITFHTG